MKIKVPSWMIKFFSHIYFFKTPFFLIYNPQVHKVKGHESRQVCNKIKAGDILIRRFDGYLSSRTVPGFWSHVGIYIENHRIIHAIGKGVVNEDILDFLRTDHIAVLRIRNVAPELILNAIQKALEMVEESVDYDYEFADNNGKVYCTEMVNVCFNELFRHDYVKVAGNKVLNPDNVYECDLVDNIIEFRH